MPRIWDANAANVVVNYYPPKRDDADEVVRKIETECGTAIAARGRCRQRGIRQHEILAVSSAIMATVNVGLTGV
jgi:hypothetical protein